MLSKFTNQLMRQNKALPRRFFDLHEYQSKKIMLDFGVKVQKGKLAATAQEAFETSQTLSNKGGLILKAQIHAGGGFLPR